VKTNNYDRQSWTPEQTLQRLLGKFKKVRASHRGLAGCDAKEREESYAEGTKAFRSFIAKQGDSYDGICTYVM
jgi:hypothetical protein